MSLVVHDVARLRRAQQQLEVRRTLTWTADASPPTARFTLPAAALIGHTSHAHTIQQTSGQQRVHEIALGQPLSTESPPRQAEVEFLLPARDLNDRWAIEGRGFLEDVAEYALSIRFGAEIDRGSWAPGPFLTSGVVEGSNDSVVLHLATVDPTRPLLIDYGATLSFVELRLDEAELRSLLDGMPALKAQADRRDDAFAEVRMVILLHFLEDLCPFLMAFEERGLDPKLALLLHKDYPYRSFARVKATVSARGYTVAGPVRAPTDQVLTDALVDFFDLDDREIVVVEDGGYVLPALHNDDRLRPRLSRVRGVVEQTTYGSRRATEILAEERRSGRPARLGTVLIDVAQSEVKAIYEPSFVAEAACHNVVRLLPGMSWIDTSALVVGYGAIGRSLAAYLHRANVRVSVCDPSPVRLVLARNDGAHMIAPTVEALLQQAEAAGFPPDYVFGTTGSTSITAALGRQLAKHHPTLISLSSKQVEFDIGGIEQAATRTEPWRTDAGDVGRVFHFSNGDQLRLLGDGYPINFVGGESIANRHIDPIMTLLHACAAEIAVPDVLTDDATSGGGGHPRFPALPDSGVSTTVVDEIVQRHSIFEPMLHSTVRG